MNMYRRKIELFISLREAFPSIENSNHFLRNLWQLMKAWCLYPSNVCSYWQKGSFQNLQKTNPCNFFKWFLFNEKTQWTIRMERHSWATLDLMNVLSTSLHPLATLETINLVRTITLKRRFLICLHLSLFFKASNRLLSIIPFFSHHYHGLIFTLLVTWETLVLNWFCGIVGKGKLLIPFYVFHKRARKRWVALYSCIKFLMNYLFEVILPTFCSSFQ